METKEIKGITAQKGVARGRVRIVNGEDGASGMVNGEIIVTKHSSANLVHLIQKAVGVVTDEGGLTSHAALISRELGIPCVVATKAATEIFKNGDEVEVNGDTGIVRTL
jgi:pyruvate, water dikinase